MAGVKKVGGSAETALARQVGGDHYCTLAIGPTEFITRNHLTYIEGCVVKYVCRHRSKNKAADIHKAIHYLELMLALEYPDEVKG